MTDWLDEQSIEVQGFPIMVQCSSGTPIWSGGTAQKWTGKKNVKTGEREPYKGFFPSKPVSCRCETYLTLDLVRRILPSRAARPVTPPTPDMPIGVNIAVGPNIVAAFGNPLVGLPPAVSGSWRPDFDERVLTAFLTIFHYCEDICWSTLGRMSEENVRAIRSPHLRHGRSLPPEAVLGRDLAAAVLRPSRFRERRGPDPAHHWLDQAREVEASADGVPHRHKAVLVAGSVKRTCSPPGWLSGHPTGTSGGPRASGASLCGTIPGWCSKPSHTTLSRRHKERGSATGASSSSPTPSRLSSKLVAASLTAGTTRELTWSRTFARRWASAARTQHSVARSGFCVAGICSLPGQRSTVPARRGRVPSVLQAARVCVHHQAVYRPQMRQRGAPILPSVAEPCMRSVSGPE